MRPLVVLLLLLAAAPATAQAPEPTEFRIEAGRHDAALQPLSEAAAIPITVVASCALLTAPQVDVAIKVGQAPAWLAVNVSPSLVRLSAAACDSGRVRGNATLHAHATADAPAFTPGEVRIQATLPHPAGDRTAEETTLLSADFSSALEVAADRSIASGAPGDRLDFRVLVANLGNAQTRVSFSALNVTAGYDVLLPAPVVLDSRQAGGARTSAEAAVTVTLPNPPGYTNEVRVVTIGLAGDYALDGAIRGDATTISFIVTTEGFAAPAGPGLAVVALVVAVSLRRR